jgi:Lon protease-like protein
MPLLTVPGFAFEVFSEELRGLPLMPISGRPLFPGACLSMEAVEPLDRALIEYALAHTDGLVVIALVRDITSFDDDDPWIEPVASLARIFPDVEREEDVMLLQCGGVGRVHVQLEYDAPDYPFSLVDVEPLPTHPGEPAQMVAALQLFGAVVPGLRAVSPDFCEHLLELLSHYQDRPGIMADLLTSLNIDQDEELDQSFQRAMFAELDDAQRMERTATQLIDLLSLLQRVREPELALRD